MNEERYMVPEGDVTANDTELHSVEFLARGTWLIESMHPTKKAAQAAMKVSQRSARFKFRLGLYVRKPASLAAREGE